MSRLPQGRHKTPTQRARISRENDFSRSLFNPLRRLDDLARFNAPRADTDPLAAAGHLGLNGTKIDIPAPLGNIVRMRDLIAELRTLAADCTNLSHDQLQITYAFRRNMRQS
jgi:hypothetical protein